MRVFDASIVRSFPFTYSLSKPLLKMIMKKTFGRLVYASLMLIAPCCLPESDVSAQSVGMVPELSDGLSVDVAGHNNTVALATLRKEVATGDVSAKGRLADALMLSAEDGDVSAINEACSLYRDAVKSGASGAHLGLAKALLREDKKHTSNKRQEAMEQLWQASARGSAEADRLLSEQLIGSSKKTKGRADAWALLVRAGRRGDTSACVELADAYLSGSWNNISVSKDGAEADRLLSVASDQGSAKAALKLALHLSQGWMDTSPEDYEASVRQLYNACLWAYESGETQLMDEINRLNDEGQIYPRTWLRAHYLFENTIHPKKAEIASENAQTLQMKVRNGIRLTQKIEGASGEPTLTVLGFPYDAQYLWDGGVTLTEGGRLSVASDDPYWPSVLRRQKSDGMPCFVKLLDGDYAGLVAYVPADWVAGEDRMIALEETYSYVFEGTSRVALGQWRSLFSIFGQYNSVGLRPGVTADDADQVILLNSVDQKIERFFFNSDLMAWVSTDASTEPIADLSLPPWQALFVLRREEAPLYLTLDGALSETPPSLPIDPGINLVANLEGELLSELGSDAFSGSTIRADSFPIYHADASGEGVSLELDPSNTGWWEMLGISADTPIYINNPSAFIITGDDQAVPFFLQR